MTEPPKEILPDEDGEVEIYSEKDYFYRSPRVTNEVMKKKVKFDAPPQKQNDEQKPLFLVIGSSISFGAISLMYGVNTISKLSSGEATLMQSLPQIAMMVGFLIGMLLIPLISRKYEKKKRKKQEEKRLARYKIYIDEKVQEINRIMEEQKKILFNTYPSTDECRSYILSKNSRLWERKINDRDFLTIRLGIGKKNVEADIDYPDKGFKMDDDELLDLLSNVVSTSNTEIEAPTIVSLREKSISAMVFSKPDREFVRRYIEDIVCQLISTHSYEDLKIVFLTSENRWENMKSVPHTWNDTKDFRFFASNYADAKEISKYLEVIFDRRVELSSNSSSSKEYRPQCLIITDNYQDYRNLGIINKLNLFKQNVGFSLLCISDNMVELPDNCQTFICIENGVGRMFDSGMAQATMVKFDPEISIEDTFESVAEQLSNIPIRYQARGNVVLKENLQFLELYDVGKIEQLNVAQRWGKNDSSISLDVPIGVDENGNAITLDIHENFHGPHGLIAGSTGSRKK